MSYFDAFRVARQAPVQAWGETNVLDLSDDEASDEEMLLVESRQKSKVACQQTVAHGFLPAGARQSLPPKSPFASMALLSEAADVLGNITSPQLDNQQQSNSIIWQKLQTANLLPVSAATAASSTSTASGIPTASLETTAPLEVATSPAKKSSAHRHSDALKRARCTEFFCMDSAACSSGNAAARESSLFRSYEVLDVQHHSLDDGCDAELSKASGRASSISRCYDSLGGQDPPTLPSKDDSPAMKRRGASGEAPVVREALRGLHASLDAMPSLSAMELDLDDSGSHAAGQRIRRGAADVHRARASTATARTRQAQPSSRLRGTTAVSGQPATMITLPPLADVKGVAEFPLCTKSGRATKTRSRSGGASRWDVPPLRPAMALDGRQMLF